MKRLLMILMIIIIILLTVNSKNKLDLPPDKMPGWWEEKTDQEQYDYFRQMAIEYVKLNDIINEKEDLLEESKKIINESNEFLKKYKPFIPGWGMDINVILLFDSSLTADYIFNFNYNKYFLNGRFFIRPGFSIKGLRDFSINQSGIGGGLNFGFGFVLSK